MLRSALKLPLLLAFLAPTALQGQRPPAPGGAGWSPIEVGARVGYDSNSNGTVVGAQIRIPVLPSGMFELVPNGDVTFLTGLKEYQFAIDAVWVTGARRGGPYLGGGLAMRNSIYPDTGSERETKTGVSVVAGLRAGSIFGGGFSPQIELRWVFVDDVIKPRIFTLGVNVPLWGRR